MTTSKYNLSNILSNAWSFFKSNLFPTFSECLEMAWKRAKIVRQMREGVAHFSFNRKDGSVRQAIATLRQGNFTYESKGSTKRKNPANVKFYCLEKQAFRSFNITSLIAA